MCQYITLHNLHNMRYSAHMCPYLLRIGPEYLILTIFSARADLEGGPITPPKSKQEKNKYDIL